MKKATVKKSGRITVKVANETDPTQTLVLEKGSTVADAMEEAEISIGSQSLHVDGQKADPQDELQDGDIIVVTGKKEGGVEEPKEPADEDEEDDEDEKDEKDEEDESSAADDDEPAKE